jgi:hypothetical protein
VPRRSFSWTLALGNQSAEMGITLENMIKHIKYVIEPWNLTVKLGISEDIPEKP